MTTRDNDGAMEFIETQIARARTNLHVAIRDMGSSAVRAANPVPWFKRYPLKCGIAAGVLLAGGAAAAVVAIRKKGKESPTKPDAPPVHVYVKNPSPRSGRWNKVATAVLGAVGSQVMESLKSTIAQSLTANSGDPTRGQPAIAPNSKPRDFQI